MNGLKVISSAENSNLRVSENQKFEDCWPEFMRHDKTVMKYKAFRDQEFAQFHFFLLNDHDQAMALCKAIPMYWDGTYTSVSGGYDKALEAAIEQYRLKGTECWNTLMGTSVSIFEGYRGEGLSAICLKAMKAICKDHHFAHLIIPVRPTLKHKYPEMKTVEYLQMKDERGKHFDPWMRTHLSMGAKIIGIAEASMLIEGSVQDWQNWTGMRFPTSGNYAIPQALSLIEINLEKDTGIYKEPNVWVEHDLAE